MRQTTLLGAQVTVVDGESQTPEGPQEIRVPIFVDPQTGEQFHFPMTKDKAESLGKLLLGEKPSDIVVPDREPSPEELERIAKATSGQAPPPDSAVKRVGG